MPRRQQINGQTVEASTQYHSYNNNKLQKNESNSASAHFKRKETVNSDKSQIVWRNVIGFLYLHIGTVYGFYILFTSGKLATFFWAFFLTFPTGFGITAGAHRLWCHRSYKAKWPLRLILALFQTLAFQNSIYEWVRDHRVHHKFTDTDADPHNSKRGFFFSHMGWLMLKKHPDVKLKGSTVDMSDLEEDAIVMWQKKTFLVIMPLISFIIPALVPYYFWDEPFWNSWYMASVGRYTITLHFTWLVNSAAHLWGTKPFDRNISASENVSVAIFALGEGWHNYHHVFPWDYKTGELGGYNQNITTAFIDFFAKIGWAYDLKTVSPEIVQHRIKRTGDGTHPSCTQKGNGKVGENEIHIWGWGDKDMPEEDIRKVNIINKKD